ncbi:MAG TPA: threonine ammonia-lyase, biosynthetic [Steroidobacteraceae bacterium]|nr:threonine ammonia-lyase, biosynthetic [Steroidobacteraceae bacterium]
MTDNYIERILRARVYDVAMESPLEAAPRLSRRVGNSIFLKREDLQPVFSFKLRGAYNKIAHLSESVARRGVICASAGNHAQGVALAARRRGIPAVIVMPQTTPNIKVNAVRDLGGEVVLHGDDYDSAYEHAQSIVRERNLAFVHPFDDPDVIAGQGTVAVEIMRQSRNEVDAIFVPVGGGGLISGIAVYAKYLNPKIKIIGVEPVDAAAMHDSMRAKKRVVLDRVGIFADGVAVRKVGEETFRLCREHVDEIVLVDTDEICAGIQDVFEDTRSIVEGAGALAVAGIKKYCALHAWEGKRIVAVNSGANMNFDVLRYVAERSDVGQAREALLAVEIPEQPGSFLKFCEILGQRAVTEFNYRYGAKERAQIFVGFAVLNKQERDEMTAKFKAAGYGVTDMTDNEMAKLHVRYMVGGHVNGNVANERLYRFEFPERKGALLNFLQAVGTRWNITLFHYRNHGSDYGRVLAGIDVPPSDTADFLDHLNVLHFSYSDETNNPAYRIFLG